MRIRKCYRPSERAMYKDVAWTQQHDEEWLRQQTALDFWESRVRTCTGRGDVSGADKAKGRAEGIKMAMAA